MKKGLLCIVLMAALIMASGAQAAMWVGGELGASWLANGDIKISNSPLLGDSTAKGVRFDNPQAIGGLTIGYDFVNSGFLGYDWPKWMSYFGFLVDFTYNRIEISKQSRTFSGTVNQRVTIPEVDGWVTAVAFGPYVHYGFFPDSEITVGRVHPYLAAGPAIATARLNLGDLGVGGTTSTVLAFFAEAGIRYVLLPNVTADTAFRYRFASPSWNASNTGAKLRDFESFNVLARINYHF